ncbi:MAG: hypothetical protein N0A16_04165 [Blastocatellia bacterium]|nr:hypothetical protein [Blastocatellia bacterium]MCS7156906.1 hypothetical protein [Blastocatellia bacterium]MCX7752105.1 hypothetical protein [Blastocatellia bacterium]MDW8167598.1 hypothetical protein [Acidobacteriota bacterium]MDW8256198.1 hypothetical protein [Acidobacteriota bacterium]
MRQAASWILILLLGIPWSLASASAQSASERFFPVDQVRPGLHGIGKTVFEGDQVEEFGVEILGVLPGRPGPKQSVIIARLTGPRFDRTRIFAGMSGSPVYIDGRLLGAIAYTFPFAMEPIAGITPIQDMMESLEAHSPSSPSSSPGMARVSAALFEQARDVDLLSRLFQSLLPLERIPIEPNPRMPASLRPFSGQQLVPIATPLSISGISPEAFERFSPELQKLGFFPIVGISAGAAITPLAPITAETLTPGKSVSVQLMRGDLSIEAIGTVTWREDKKVYAFGHRLFNLGGVEMPLSEASTIAVVPSLMNSFKLGVTEKLVGTLRQDRSAGVLGILGEAPRMIPLTIQQKKSRGGSHTYRVEMINNSVLTPLLVNLAVFNAVTGSERSFGDMTVRVRGTIKVRGHEDVLVDGRFSAMNEAPAQAALSVALPVSYLLNSGFEVTLEGIHLEIETLEQRRVGMLDRVWVNRTEVKRGETIELQIYARAEDGREVVERMPLQIPADVPPGKLSIIVGDGNAIQAYDGRSATASLGSVQSLAQLIRTLNRLRKSDRLYVKLVRSSLGAIVKNEELPALPPSVLATIGSERTAGGYQSIPYTTLKEMELPPGEFVITGQRQVSITVVR